jgi:hypothetical protein
MILQFGHSNPYMHSHVVRTGVPPFRQCSGSGTVHVHIGSTTACTPMNKVVLVYLADGTLLLLVRKLMQDVLPDAFYFRHLSMLIINNVTPSSCSITALLRPTAAFSFFGHLYGEPCVDTLTSRSDVLELCGPGMCS